MTSHRNYRWLRNLNTGGEKWVLYINCTHRRQWLSAGQTAAATPKTDPKPKKVMLSIWCGVKGILHWEFLPNGCTITADLYCQQLDRLAQKFKGKQDRISFLHANAPKTIGARMGYCSTSASLSRLGSYCNETATREVYPSQEQSLLRFFGEQSLLSHARHTYIYISHTSRERERERRERMHLKEIEDHST